MRLTLVPLEVSLAVLLTLLTTSPALADRTAAARNQGFQLYEAGRYQEAIGELDRVLQKHPRDLEALMKRGNCYLRLDQPARRCRISIESSTTAHCFREPSPTAGSPCSCSVGTTRRWKASTGRFAPGRWPRSWTRPRSWTGSSPVPNLSGSLSGTKSRQIVQGHATAQSGLGQAYHRLGQDEQAIVEYNRAIEIYALDPNAYIGRGDCRVSRGDHDQALADYNEAIRLGPNYSRAYSSRGKLLEAMGQDAQAEADYDRAIQLDPSFTYALRLRGAALPARPERQGDRGCRCGNPAPSRRRQRIQGPGRGPGSTRPVPAGDRHSEQGHRA